MAEALSPEKCERIRRLCDTYDGVAVIRIARISSSTLYALKKRNFRPMSIGVQRKQRPADFTVVMNYKTIPQLARHYQVGEPTVRDWLEGLDRSYRSQRSHARPDREAIYRALVAAGTLVGAADLLGVSKTTLRKWRTEYGLPSARSARFHAFRYQRRSA